MVKINLDGIEYTVAVDCFCQKITKIGDIVLTNKDLRRLGLSADFNVNEVIHDNNDVWRLFKRKIRHLKAWIKQNQVHYENLFSQPYASQSDMQNYKAKLICLNEQRQLVNDLNKSVRELFRSHGLECK